MVEVDGDVACYAEVFGENSYAVEPAFPSLAFGTSHVDQDEGGLVASGLHAPVDVEVAEDGDVVVIAEVTDLPDPGLVVFEGFEDFADAPGDPPPLGIFNWASGYRTPCLDDSVIKALNYK